MPSLRSLEEFKSSFNKVGGELESLEEMGMPFDDLPLPEHEPSSVSAAGTSASNGYREESFPREVFPDAGVSRDGFDLPPDDTETELPESSDLFDFGDLGDLIGGRNITIPDFQAADDISENTDEAAGENKPPEKDGGTSIEDEEFGSFIDTIPDDFPQNEETGETPGDFPSAETGAGSTDSFDPDDFNLDELFPDEAGDAAAASDSGTLSGFGTDQPASGEAGDDDFALPDEDFAADGLFGDEETGSYLGGESGADDLDPGGETAAGDFDIPPGLLDGLADEIEAETPDDSESDESFPSFDSGEMLELPGETELLGENADSGDFLDESGFPDFDEVEQGETKSEKTDSDDFGLDDILGEADLYSEAGDISDAPGDIQDSISAADSLEDDDSFDLGGETSEFETDAVLEEIPEDSFDNFKLDADTFSENFDLGGEDSEVFKDDFAGSGGFAESGGFGEGGEFASLEEFSIPGLDGDFGEKTRAAGAAGKRAANKTGGGTSKTAPGEVEEIRLSDEELNSFQETLSSYPLNLRIACEELIAEQAVAPDAMSRLVRLLVNGAPAKETAALAGKILNKKIPIPKAFEKKTGEELEAEQSSFAYIFVHNFLPVLRLFAIIAGVVLCVAYLGWRFIYTPLKAEGIYELGYERIAEGEYGRANERFREAFAIHDKEIWFYRYARAFRDARQYTLAEEKYGELLNYTASKNSRYIPSKEAALEFAGMETNYIGNYEMADRIIRRNILDYYPEDREALLALGDNSLAWGEYENARFEDAREAYARLMERYGRSDPILERMLKYFIRTDNLGEVLPLGSYFMASESREISADTLAELGGYYIDKRVEEVRGVPNEYLDGIGGIREILLRAIEQESMLPESYYHLARYYNYFENINDERTTLELAVKVFEAAGEETPKRVRYHINALSRYGEILINSREFFAAEETLVKGTEIYEDGILRRLLKAAPEFGKLYANLGDLEYFVKEGDMRSALEYYGHAEENGYAPPEIQYRMGAAHYQLREWGSALERLSGSYRETAPNRRILYALGNVSYMRGNYFAAQGYYDRLIEILEDDRERLSPVMPTNDEKQLELAERLMTAQNNLAVTLEALTERTGNNTYRSRAYGLYADSERAWDVLTRNPESMVRMRPSSEISAPGVNPAYLNIQNSLHPVPGYEQQFFLRIDKDLPEQSEWEELSPPGYRLSEGIYTGRQ